MNDDLSLVRRQIAPGGTLRAAINTGNTVLAQQAADGSLSGVTVALAGEIARRLSLPLQLVPYDGAGKVVDAAGADVWDIAFLAVDPKRADVIDFSAPYVLIEGAFVVRAAAPFARSADVDAASVRIAVGKGAAYDLYLSRTFQKAEFIRYPTSAAALEGFLAEGLDAGAGIRQPIAAFAGRNAGLRVLPDAFMQIRQAMALPRGRAAAAAYVEALLKDLKASGFIAEALTRSGQGEATVAP